MGKPSIITHGGRLIPGTSLSLLCRVEIDPRTRREILSIVSSLYDPLGIVAPVILPAKKILQDLFHDQQCGWDDEISHGYKERWQQWQQSLSALEDVKFNRCIKNR